MFGDVALVVGGHGGNELMRIGDGDGFLAGGGGVGNEVIGLGFEYEAEEGEVMGLFFYLIK